MNASALLSGVGLSLAAGETTSRRVGALVLHGRLGTRPSRRVQHAPLWWGVVAAVCGACLVVVVGGAWLGTAAGVAGLTLCSMCADVRRQRSADRRRAGLLASVRMVAADLDAGARPDDALAAAADVSPHYAAALRRASVAAGRGESFTSDDVDLAPLAIGYSVAARSGAPLAGVLARVADDLEQAESRSQRLAALTAGPRASAAVLALLPVLALLLGESIGARPVHVLLHNDSGKQLACAGVVLDALGVIWVRYLVRSARRWR